MKVNVYDLKGKATKKVELPSQFHEPLRLDLIRKGVTAARANRRQPYGPSDTAGMRHSVEQWGKGRGTARVMRLKGSRRAAQAPLAVGGRRAHPPLLATIWSKGMNRKERQKARRSAIAATSDASIVAGRGHRFPEKLTLPVVVVDEFAEITKVADALAFFESIGVSNDLDRAKSGRHERSGRGKMRGRRFRTPRSILVVTAGTQPVHNAVRNFPGVDAVPVERISVEDLAPGGDPGRLTVMTESALQEVSKWT
ncbi:MAG: 50S ribosomal protein L4 [Thermoplasmata archaeon]|nr:50S ribosomal protein L4 [Thermoplasmata archaeon]